MSVSSDSLASLKKYFKSKSASLDLSIFKELHMIAELIFNSPDLQHFLTDPANSKEKRLIFIDKSLGVKVSSKSLSLFKKCIEKKWNNSLDLVFAVERLANLCAIFISEIEDSYSRLECELLEFSNLLDKHIEFRKILDSHLISSEEKIILVKKLSYKFSEISQLLIMQSMLYPKKLHVLNSFSKVISILAEYKQKFIAMVDSSVKLTEEQEKALFILLKNIYGHPVTINLRINPKIIGGFKISVDDEIIDATIYFRINELRKKLSISKL